MELTLAHLKHILHYDPETGIWTWLNPPNHNTRLQGKPAGNRRNDGYLMIRIRGRLYYSARLAVFYVTGEWPKDEVDHIDRDPSNDRWVNIREATSSQNKYNKTRTGIVGIYLSGSVAGTWWAMAGKKYLGSFSSIEEAIEARKVALLELGHGDFAELN